MSGSVLGIGAGGDPTYVGSGIYSLSASGLISAFNSWEYVGEYGTSRYVRPIWRNQFNFRQRQTRLGYTSSTSGVYNLNGGLQNFGTLDGAGGNASILASNSIVDFSSGSLANFTTGGSLSIGANSLLIVPSGISPASAFKYYSNLGLTHTAGTTLAIGPGQSFAGAGTIYDYTTCQGSIAAATGQSINLYGGVNVSGTGQVGRGYGGADVSSNSPASGMSGGSLAMNYLYVGYYGAATFAQTSGTATIGNLYVGQGASATYSLSAAGRLNSSNETIGSYASLATFSQAGGINSAYSVTLGSDSGSNGYYNLSGGSLGTTYLTVGNLGASSFTQTGSSVAATYAYIASGASGIYNLSGAGQLSTSFEYLGQSSVGTFNQTGGTNATPALTLGFGYGSAGYYNLSGGLLSVSQVNIGSGYGVLNFSAGTIAASGNGYINVPISLSNASGNQTINTNGSAMTLYDPISGARQPE